MIEQPIPFYVKYKQSLIIGGIALIIGYSLGFYVSSRSRSAQYAEQIMSTVQQGFKEAPSSRHYPYDKLVMQELKALRADMAVLLQRQTTSAQPGTRDSENDSSSSRKSPEESMNKRRRAFDQEWNMGRQRILDRMAQ